MKKLVVGNWKMNGSLAANEALIKALKADMPKNVQTAVCVPAPYLAQVSGLLKGSEIGLGAQNVSEQASGAFTGEVSIGMLKEFGCQYVIIGHSVLS